MSGEPLILGIETSCDETGIGIVEGRRLLADEVASSVDEQARFGGVVPEVASRAHLEAIIPTIERALATAGVRFTDLDGIAVTGGPGLAGALLVGVSTAKALAYALGLPLLAVNHLAGHVVVDELEHGPLPQACVGLLVSGGHSSLLEIRGGQFETLGSTLDDAAGEAFDKVARLLGLPFPGGPVIDRLAQDGNRQAIAFPRGLSFGLELQEHPYDFSFSGLKTAVARWVAQHSQSIPVADVAASFQEAVVDVLTMKAVQACARNGIDVLVLGGGVAANSRLRELAVQRCSQAGITLRIPSPRLCTDNGAMIATLGAWLMERNARSSPWTVGADPGLPIATVQILADGDNPEPGSGERVSGERA